MKNDRKAIKREPGAPSLIDTDSIFTNNKDIIGNRFTRAGNVIKEIKSFVENPSNTSKDVIGHNIDACISVIKELDRTEVKLRENGDVLKAEEVKKSKIELFTLMEMMAAAFNMEEAEDSIGYSKDDQELLKAIKSSIFERPAIGWSGFDEIAGGESWMKVLGQEYASLIDGMIGLDKSSWKSLPGLVLAGPPGTGKNQIVYALAELFYSQIRSWNAANPNKIPRGFKFLAPKAGTLQDKYVGNSEKIISLLVDQAQVYVSQGNIVLIFFDEFDGVFGTANKGSARASLIAAFKALTGNEQSKINGVCFVGATNHPEFVDTGILARFKNKFYVGLPTKEDHGANIQDWYRKLGGHRFRGDKNSLSNNMATIAQIWEDNRLSNRDTSDVKRDVMIQFDKISSDFASPPDEVEYSMYLRQSAFYTYDMGDEKGLKDEKGFLIPIGHLNTDWVKKNLMDSRSKKLVQIFSSSYVPTRTGVDGGGATGSFLRDTSFDREKSPWYRMENGSHYLIGNLVGKMDSKLSIIITRRIKTDNSFKMTKFMTVNYPIASKMVSNRSVDTTNPDIYYNKEDYPLFQNELTSAQISWEVIAAISKKAKPQSISEAGEWMNFFRTKGGVVIEEIVTYSEKRLKDGKPIIFKKGTPATEFEEAIEGDFEIFKRREQEENSSGIDYDPFSDERNGDLVRDGDDDPKTKIHGYRGKPKSKKSDTSPLTWSLGDYLSINPITRDFMIFIESYSKNNLKIIGGETK